LASLNLRRIKIRETITPGRRKEGEVKIEIKAEIKNET
jgi:hypothetical protein